MIWALHKNQPLAFHDLYKKAGISQSQLYRNIPLLLNQGIIRELSERKYALSDYNTLEEFFFELKRKYSGLRGVSLDDLAHAVGRSPEKIREEAYRLAKKHGLRIGPKTFHKGKRMSKVFS